MAKTVLVVAEDAELLEMLTAVLGYNGYVAVPCAAPVEAPAQVKDCHPSAIILDLPVPEWQAWQAISSIRGDPKTNRIPIIACTIGDLAIQQRAAVLRELDCEVLIKPFEIGELLYALTKVTTQHDAN